MRFTINTKDWLPKLENAVRLVPKTQMQILETILLKVFKDRLDMTTSNGDMHCVSSLAITNGEDGTAAVDAKVLLNLVRMTGGLDITLEKKDEDNSLRLDWGGGNASLPVFDAASFPPAVYPSLEDKDKITMFRTESSVLHDAFSTLSSFMADNSPNPVLESVAIDVREQNATAVSTDARTLVKTEIPVETIGVSGQCVIPASAIRMANVLLAKAEGLTVLAFYEKNGIVRIDSSSTFLTFRTQGGKYPDWKRTFPKEFSDEMSVNRQELISCIRRVLVSAGDNSVIKLTLTKDTMLEPMEISAVNHAFSMQGTQRVMGTYTGEGLIVHFNGKRLLELLGAYESEELTLRFCGEKRATLVEPSGENKGGISGIIMPVAV